MKKLKALGAILLIAVLTFITLTQGLPPLMELSFPTTGTLVSGSIEATWLNETEVKSINWGITENATAYTMEPIKITNLYNVPIILNLSYANPINIISITLTWNYTGALLNPNQNVTIELTQTVTASQLTYSYNTVINATGVT